MMKVQGLIVAARSLSGDRRPTFGFDALPFVEVVFFPSSFLVGVVLLFLFSFSFLFSFPFLWFLPLLGLADRNLMRCRERRRKALLIVIF